MTASRCFSASLHAPCRTSAAAPRPRRGGRRSQCLPGEIAGHALVDEGGGVGHDPDDRRARGQPRLEVRGRDAGGERHHERCPAATWSRISLDQRGHVLRLDDEHERVGRLRPPRRWTGPARRSAAASASAASGRALGDDEVVGRRGPTGSGPDSSVSPMTPAPKIARSHGSSSAVAVGFSPWSRAPRRKNMTLAGFSAIRRMR